MSTQTSFSDLSTGSESASDDDEAEITVSLKSRLKELNVKPETTNRLTDEFDSVAELVSRSDINLKQELELTEREIEKVRQDLDDTVGDDYRITDSGEGYCESEWTEEASEREDILTGKLIAQEFIENIFDSKGEFLTEIKKWARAHESTDYVSTELTDAIQAMTPQDVSEETLSNISADFEPAYQDVLESRGLMAYADLNGHRGIYLSAAEDARRVLIDGSRLEKPSG